MNVCNLPTICCTVIDLKFDAFSGSHQMLPGVFVVMSSQSTIVCTWFSYVVSVPCHYIRPSKLISGHAYI